MFFLAWRNLSQNRPQFVLGVGGVALALLLMLALDALLAASAITFQDMRRAAHAEGAASASPILYTTTVIETGQADVLSYIISFDPDEPLGGPQTVVAGTTRVKRNEAIIDEAVARSQGLSLGDEVDILGETFTIVGLTSGMTNILNSVTFVHFDDFQTLRGRSDAVGRKQAPGGAVAAHRFHLSGLTYSRR